MIQKQELQKHKKTKVDAEVAAFTCLLVYFVVKAIVLLILYKYDNLLKHQYIYIPPFALLLIINTYLMLTVGKDPGFQTASFQENQLLQYNRDQNNFCAVCNCRKKNRSKHCYLCGKCVRKYDHHCPWIGACVGQNNHFKFWLLLITHTLQATFTFYILFKSMDLYQYKHSDGSFSAQYGAFAIFSFFMLLYIGFTGPLVIFHGYLILMNITSRELLRRKKCPYLANVRGNPYFAGLCQNLKQVMFVQEKGRYQKSYQENGSFKLSRINKALKGLGQPKSGRMIITLAAENLPKFIYSFCENRRLEGNNYNKNKYYFKTFFMLMYSDRISVQIIILKQRLNYKQVFPDQSRKRSFQNFSLKYFVQLLRISQKLLEASNKFMHKNLIRESSIEFFRFLSIHSINHLMSFTFVQENSLALKNVFKNPQQKSIEKEVNFIECKRFSLETLIKFINSYRLENLTYL